jgi:hypothetical protein
VLEFANFIITSDVMVLPVYTFLPVSVSDHKEETRSVYPKNLK